MLETIFSFFTTIVDSIGLILIVCTVLFFILKKTFSVIHQAFGRYGVYFFGSVGVPVHEISHFILCLVFRHKVNKIALYSPDEKSGTLGYVEHSYDRGSIYQLIGCFFIGIAPLVGGSLALHLVTDLLFSTNPISNLLAQHQDNLTNTSGFISLIDFSINLFYSLSGAMLVLITQQPIAFIIWLTVTGSIAINMFPSPADMKNSYAGVIALLAILFAVSLVANDHLSSFFSSISFAINIWLFYLLVACYIATLFTVLMLIPVISKKAWKALS